MKAPRLPVTCVSNIDKSTLVKVHADLQAPHRLPRCRTRLSQDSNFGQYHWESP